MLAGTAQLAGGDAVAQLRRRYLAVHPSAEMFVDFKDFAFFRIEPTAAHLVAGFGRINDLAPAEFLTDLTGAEAMLEAEEGAVAHMNADHRDALNLYATKLLGAAPGDWSCTGCDPDGLDMQDGATVLRLDFPRRIVTPGALRAVLRELAEQARSVTIERHQGGT
jgi:putative heme iron utilization protein